MFGPAEGPGAAEDADERHDVFSDCRTDIDWRADTTLEPAMPFNSFPTCAGDDSLYFKTLVGSETSSSSRSNVLISQEAVDLAREAAASVEHTKKDSAPAVRNRAPRLGSMATTQAPTAKPGGKSSGWYRTARRARMKAGEVPNPVTGRLPRSKETRPRKKRVRPTTETTEPTTSNPILDEPHP